MDPTQANEPPEPKRGSVSHAISNMMVRLLTEFTGRGPTHARTYIHDDLITIVMRDTLTKGERSLVGDGRTEHVLETRRLYQRTMRPAIVSTVEELTGRRVIAFLGDNHVDPDIAVETLLLEPSPDGDSDAGTGPAG